MKATKIYYKKLFNLGNYQHEEIGIELEIEPGEKAEDVFNKAKLFIDSKSMSNEFISEYKRYKNIIDNPDDFTGKEVKRAEDFMSRYDGQMEFPF